MISIQRQLTRELLGAVLLLLGIGLAALYFAARHAATEEFDHALQAKALAISTLTVQTPDGVRVEFTDRFMRGFEDNKPRDYFQIWDASGREIARSESLRVGASLTRRTGKIDKPAQWNFRLPNGRAGRGLGFAFTPKASDPSLQESRPVLQLVAASDREELDETLWELLGWSAIWGVLLIGVTLWLVPRVLQRGLQPLGQLGDQAARIDADSLATRFTLPGLPAELQPIGQRLNDLLGRLEQSFDRERRFSADLAHELRTPLAELRSSTECALKWPDTRDSAVDRETLAIAQQMERIVTHILALARGEEGQLELNPERLPLGPVLETLWQPFGARAVERGLTVSFQIDPCEGLADPSLLRSILTNLYENAVDYTTAAGDISVVLRPAAAGRVLITIANRAIDLEPGDLPKLFDRFWRKEAARSGGLHVGLGLSLSRAFAEAMQWTLTAAFDGHGRVIFSLAGPGGALARATAPTRENMVTA